MAITESEFAERVKSKYPQYKDIDDTELVSLVLDRYPEYSTQLGEKEYSKNLFTNTAKTLVSGGVQAAINAGAGVSQSYSLLLGDKSDTSEEAVEEYASQRRVKQRKGGSRMAKGKILAHRKRKNEVIQSLNENAHRLRTLANSTDERFNIDPKFANSFGGQVLKGFGQMVGNIGAAVVGTAVAGPVGGVAAAVGTIAPQMVSESVSDSEATLGKSYMDMTEEEKEQVALATAGYATLGTALEFAPVARLPWVKNFLRGKTKVAAGVLKSPSVRREIAKGFAAEGFTEAAQGQLLDSLARATFDDDRELMSWDVLRQRFNEFAVGGIVGGGTSGGIATIQKAAQGELFKPKETKEVFQVSYADQNTGQPATIEIDAENQEDATRIAGERLAELATEGTIVARPKPAPEPVTEEVVAEEVIPETEQAELQEELQEEVSEPAPTPEPAPAPQPEPVQEVDSEAIKEQQDTIDDSEARIADLQSEIEIEKSNIKEARARNKKEIADVRKSKLSKEEKTEQIEDLKASLQDEIDDVNGNIGIYKEEMSGFKKDLRKAKKKLAGLQPKEDITAGAAAVGLTPKEFTSRLKDTKVVDDQGKPLRVYRGTSNIEFETEGRGRVSSFTSSPDVASTYSSTIGGGPFNIRLSFKEGASVSPVFLSMKKPLDFTAEDNFMSLGNYLAYMEYGNDKNGITKEEVDQLINYMVKRGRGKTKAKGDFVFRLDDSFTTPEYRPSDFSRDEYSDLVEFKDEYDSGLSLEDGAIQDGLYFDQFIAADAPVTKRVAERLGFDGIIHKDAFGLKEEYEQLTGKKVEGLSQETREDGLNIIEDDIHITYRPFSEEQVIGSLQQPEVTAGAAPVEPGDTTEIRSVVRDAMKIRIIQRHFTETLVEDGVFETGSLEEINEKVSDFALLKEAEYFLDFAESESERGRVQSLIDTLKAIRAEDTRPRTKIDEEIEAFAPFGKSITSREELRDFVFSFSPIAEKLGFKIKPRRSGNFARFSPSNNAVEIVFPKLYRRISEALDLQGGGRRTGTGFVTALMREEIIHGTVNQVLIKKGIKDTQAWYEQLGRDLTQAQRDEVNDVYNIEEGYEGILDYGYGVEYSRMIIQRGLYGNVTEAFTGLNKGTAYDKMVALLKSVQAYITKALKGEVTTNPEAAGVIMEAARLLQSVDPEAKLVNQKVVNDSLAYSVDVNPNAEVTSEQVAESGKPPSEKKLNVNFARKYLFTVSSLLNSIHPRLKKLVRDYYGAIQGEVLDYQKRVAPFFKKYRGIKNADDRKRLKQLLSYSPVRQEGVDPLIEERDALLRKYDLFNDYQLEIRPVLNELYNRLGNEGIMIGFLEQYFPRSIKDLDKVKNRAGKELRDAFREFIETRNERIEKARRNIEEGNPKPGDVALSKETTIQIGNPKTAALEAQQWDQFTRGFNAQGRRNLPGNFLSRSEELNVIPDNLLDAYADPAAAMERYIYNAVTAIQTTRLMGSKFANVPEGLKVPPASELGLLIQELRANGEISMEDADGTVPDIFAMILSPVQVENIYFQLARTFGYGTLLVEFTSTLSQLYDLPFIMLDNGIFGTAVAAFGPRLKGDDFGIDVNQVSVEFASDNRVLDKAVRLGLKATGFTKLDQVMKETNLTANYNRYRKLARGYFKDRNSAKSKKFVAELTSMGYSEQEQTKLIADLKAGNRDSAYIRTLLFNKLSETQPLTKAEMALGIVNNPNLRFTVAMKSFMVKQLNFVKDRMVNEFIDGVRTGNARKIKKASSDIALLMTFLLMIGLPVDALKDFLAGRLGYMSDYLFNGMFRVFGISRYTVYQARKEGVGQAALDFFTPVAIQQFVDATSELDRVIRGERAITESKFVTLLPFSDVINRIFGFQQERERKEFMRRVREGERPFIVPPGAL